MSDERVNVVIDGSNFYHGATRILQTQKQSTGLPLRYNYAALAKWLCGDRHIVSQKYYVGLVRRDGKRYDEKTEMMVRNQQRLFAWLENTQTFRVVRGHIMRHPDKKFHEKGVDVQMALDILEGAYENYYDTVLLLSSDTDLIPAIQKVQKRGKKVEYIGFADQPSIGLTKYANVTRLLIADDVLRYVPKQLPI